MDMKTRPLLDTDGGSCVCLRKSGGPCKGRVVAFGVCVSHIRKIGGHLWVFDRYQPGWAENEEERLSYCRACAAIKTKETVLELCPIRINAPDAPCPISPDLPQRLIYRFARPERISPMTNSGWGASEAIRVGPLVAYRSGPDSEGRDWRVLHQSSKSMVALLDSKKASVSLMLDICSHGVELDFHDPMKMDDDARFNIDLSVRYHRKGRCIRAPKGLLSLTAEKSYFRPWKTLCWETHKLEGKAECRGPFALQPTAGGVLLRNLRGLCYVKRVLFGASSRERAIVFAHAAAELDLDWDESQSVAGPRYAEATRNGVVALLEKFPDIVCLDSNLEPAESAVVIRLI